MAVSGDDSTVREPFSLVGRGPLLAGLGTALDGALTGHGSLVLITGEPGVGKTALSPVSPTRRPLVGCGSPGAVALRARECRRSGRGPRCCELRGACPAGRITSPRPPPGSIREAADRFRVFDRVVRHLAEAAAESGLLVVLDDLHWADPDSLGLLEFAARQLAASRLLLAGAYRDDDAADRLRRVAATAAVNRLEGLDTDLRRRTDGTDHRRPGARRGRRGHARAHRRQPAVRP